MIYAWNRLNETDCSFCSDEIKKMKRGLQRHILVDFFALCFGCMIHVHYILVFGKDDQEHDLCFAYWNVAMLILVLIETKISYDANNVIILSQEVRY